MEKEFLLRIHTGKTVFILKSHFLSRLKCIIPDLNWLLEWKSLCEKINYTVH